MKHYTFLWVVGNFSKFSTWFFCPLEGVLKLLGSKKIWGNNISFHIQFKIDKFSCFERVIQFFVTFRTNFHSSKWWRPYNHTIFYARLHGKMYGCVILRYWLRKWQVRPAMLRHNVDESIWKCFIGSGLVYLIHQVKCTLQSNFCTLRLWIYSFKRIFILFF